MLCENPHITSSRLKILVIAIFLFDEFLDCDNILDNVAWWFTSHQTIFSKLGYRLLDLKAVSKVKLTVINDFKLFIRLRLIIYFSTSVVVNTVFLGDLYPPNVHNFV